MGQHTPGPWWTERIFEGEAVRSAATYERGEHIALVYDIGYEDEDLSEHNARRIVAAVNACEGISTEALEGGVVNELVKAVEHLAEEVDFVQVTGMARPSADLARANSRAYGILFTIKPIAKARGTDADTQR